MSRRPQLKGVGHSMPDTFQLRTRQYVWRVADLTNDFSAIVRVASPEVASKFRQEISTSNFEDLAEAESEGG